MRRADVCKRIAARDERASQRGRLEGSVKKLQARAGRVLHGQELRQGGAAGSDGCKAVRRRHTLKPHNSFSNRTLFLPFVLFSHQKNPNNDYPVPLTVHPNSWPHSGMNGKD
jgi:hypothetical protein